MPSYSTSDIRNIALLGHGGSGKTTLTEAILNKAGVIHHLGEVEKGNTVTDFTEEEKEHGNSLFSTAVCYDHKGKHVNLIDTPGFPDFMSQAIMVLPAIETAAIVINASNGIEMVTRRMRDRAKAAGLARMIVINKIDHDNIDLESLVDQIQEMFGSECLPINLPADGGKKVVDCINNDSGDSDFSSVEDTHSALVDQAVEIDDDLMEVYLEEGEISPEQLKEAFGKSMREGHLVPICFTAAKPASGDPVGIEELMEVIDNYAPTPVTAMHKFFKGEDEVAIDTDSSKSAIAHVFQVTIDSFVGKLSAFRVHQGTVKAGDQIMLTDQVHGDVKKAIKIGHILSLCGKDHNEVSEVVAGDIAAVAKVDQLHRDTVMVADSGDMGTYIEKVAYPEPMSGLAITPTRRGDEQKISDALSKMDAEDPGFKVTRDASTHETVIHGMGELHMRVLLEKLKNRYNVEVASKPPKIAYRETILANADGHHRHKKQSGGAGQFGEVYLRVAPLERGAGFEFVNDTFGGSIPSQFLPAIEKGIRQMLVDGAIAGYPMQDIQVSVYDGKHHPVDSKEVAFITAGKRAFADAVNKAKPALLEPVVNIEVTISNDHVGAITGDLSGKRGRIQGTDMLPGDMSCVRAIVPLSEVSNYQNQLKSVTGGQGSFTMEFSHYDPMPSHVQDKIIASYKPKAYED